ncbi:O-antigen ligase family protein [Sphingobium yanoikuyae]|uniref:O-antigen ligase family protein n=1 Tax=Sphingobium yanoikuyae TaxID=13690 RepID=A0A9X7UI88_SPHYA|nr:O-antigen ligase family protein [Sphingobium yanoikuyae]QNG48502.1 O-antigen ligase family protein [Sphingobium yanoikuyae]
MNKFVPRTAMAMIGGRGGELFLLVALLLGGAGRAHPVLTGLICLLSIGHLFMEGQRFVWTGRSIFFKAACLLWGTWLVLLFAQIIPLSPSIWHHLPGRNSAIAIYEQAGWSGKWHALSLTPDKSWAAIFVSLPPFLMFLLSSRATREDLRAYLAIFLGVATLSAALGILQFGAGAGSPFYPYDTAHQGAGVGLFINRNHQATFLLLAIILSPALHILGSERRGRAAPAGRGSLIAFILAMIMSGGVLATTSRTGIMLLPFAVMVALGVAYIGGATGKKLFWGLGAVALMGLAMVPTPIVQHILERFSTVAEDDRGAYWANTRHAIGTYFPAGSGLGSFRTIYPTVEPLEQVGPLRVNNAHNDYLEFALEAGLPGLILLILVLALIAGATIHGLRPSNPPRRRALILACAGGLFILMGFSLVDYPLRMHSIAIVAAMLLGLITGAPITPANGRKDAGSIIRSSILAVLALLAAWQVVAIQWARAAILDQDGETAAAVAPWTAEGWSTLADAADRADKPVAAIGPAKAALTIAPLDPVAVRALGLGLLAQGDRARGNAMLETAASLGWREEVTQYWLVGRALEFCAFDAAIARMDALLRRDRATQALLSQLVAISADPQGRQAVISALAVKPGWRQAYFNALAREADVATSLAVISGLDRTPAPVGPNETALIRWRLGDRGDWQSVRHIWEASHGKGLVGDGGFSIASETVDKAGPPLAWRNTGLAGAHVVIADPDTSWKGQALMVTSDGFTQGAVLAQTLVLAPGRYHFSFLYQSRGQGGSRVAWRVICPGEEMPAPALALRWQNMREGWKKGEALMTVGSQCPFQQLQLELEGNDAISSAFFIDDVALARVASSAH